MAEIDNNNNNKCTKFTEKFSEHRIKDQKDWTLKKMNSRTKIELHKINLGGQMFFKQNFIIRQVYMLSIYCVLYIVLMDFVMVMNENLCLHGVYKTQSILKRKNIYT